MRRPSLYRYPNMIRQITAVAVAMNLPHDTGKTIVSERSVAVAGTLSVGSLAGPDICFQPETNWASVEPAKPS